MDFYLRKREKIISRKRRMAEEVKPIYKRFTDRCIKYYTVITVDSKNIYGIWQNMFSSRIYL